MVVWYFVIGFGSFLMGWVLRGRFIRGVTHIGTDANFFDAGKLKGDEKKLYDILVSGDGVGYFAKIANEEGFGREGLDRVVSELVLKGVIIDKRFKRYRKLYLRGFLDSDAGRVLEFVSKNGGDVGFGEIMSGLGVDDDWLLKVGKRLVRLGLIVKVARGYRVFFVLREKI